MLHNIIFYAIALTSFLQSCLIALLFHLVVGLQEKQRVLHNRLDPAISHLVESINDTLALLKKFGHEFDNARAAAAEKLQTVSPSTVAMVSPGWRVFFQFVPHFMYKQGLTLANNDAQPQQTPRVEAVSPPASVDQVPVRRLTKDVVHLLFDEYAADQEEGMLTHAVDCGLIHPNELIGASIDEDFEKGAKDWERKGCPETWYGNREAGGWSGSRAC